MISARRAKELRDATIGAWACAAGCWRLDIPLTKETLREFRRTRMDYESCMANGPHGACSVEQRNGITSSRLLYDAIIYSKARIHDRFMLLGFVMKNAEIVVIIVSSILLILTFLFVNIAVGENIGAWSGFIS